MTKLLILSTALALSSLSPSLSFASIPLEPMYDSPLTLILDAKIDHGEILSPSSSDQWESEIREQLSYLQGHLGYYGAAPQRKEFEIHITGSQRFVGDASLMRVTYTAVGRISWAKQWNLETEIEDILPARGDAAGLQAFYTKYLNDCSGDKTSEFGTFFYYFYPAQDGCPLKQASADQSGWAVRFPMELSVSPENTQGKFPEYGKIWEDGWLKVTAIFGMSDEGGGNDWGVKGYNEYFKQLKREYGNPVSINEQFSGDPGEAHPVLSMQFRQSYGMIQVDVRLIQSLQSIDAEFTRWFQLHAPVSDIVYYGGHAGYGNNIEALTHLVQFRRGVYQIYFLNGCDTFTHLDTSLFDGSAAANPGFAGSKYLDLLVNAFSSYFDKGPGEIMALMHAMKDKNKTYYQIMEPLDSRPERMVEGEQDNNWPRPF